MKNNKNRNAGTATLLHLVNPPWPGSLRPEAGPPRIRPRFALSLALLFLSVTAIAQAPVLGTYPSTSVAAGRNTAVTPDAVPSNTVRATASANPGFAGVLAVNPTTGVVRVTDAKQAGTYTVTVTAFNSGGGTATATFTLTVTNPACSAGNFTGSSNVAAGATPISVAIGDFNSDGEQDLAIAEYSNAGTASIHLGDGFGGFTGSTSMAAGNFPTSVAVGDFNGDGKQDIAVSNKNSGDVSIRLGDGSGGLMGTTSVTAGTEPEFVAVGDFNSDGKQDLAVANSVSDNVSLRFGDGSGGFTGTTNMATGDLPRSIAIDDFNGDGKQDLAVANGNSRNVSIHLGNGMGGFTNNGNVPVGIQPISIAAGDFNGDGKQDIVVANSVSDNVSIRLGNGSGGFTGSTDVAVGDNPRSVAVGDFNGDGKQDFATTSFAFAGKVSIRLGDGTGGFTGTTSVATGLYPSSVAVGDFNGDNKQDLAATSSGSMNVSILLGVANEINLKGNGVDIADGDNTPAVSDHTDFGTTADAPITRTFTLQNTGMDVLNVASAAITISGPNASLFSISNIALPAAISGPSGSITFDVTYAPGVALGVHTATVNIANDDCNEALYNFDIKGERICVLPSFTSCPTATVALNTAANSCIAVATYTVTATGSPTPILTYTLTGATTGGGNGTGSGVAFNKGNTQVTVTAANACGAPTCTFTVTVTDTEKPAITCPANIVRNNDMNQCEAVVAYGAPTYSDNCPGAGLDHLNGGLSGSTFPVGTTTVTWMATDAVNNTRTCAFSITVNDTQAPNLTCPANQSLPTASGTCAAVATYSATTSDNCTASPALQHSYSGATVKALALGNGSGSGSAFNKGITTVTLRATDGVGLTKTCTFRIIVTDTEVPTMSCPAGLNVNATAGQCGAAVTYPTPTYTDNCAPTSGTAVRVSGPASGSTFSVGTTNVVFRATDAASNTRQCTLTITVTDNQPPTISCPPSLTVTGIGTPCTATVFYAAPTASDNCAGTLTPYLVSGFASGSNYPAGTSANTFRASDPNGVTVECTFSVTVNCPAAQPAPGVADRVGDVSGLSLAPNPAATEVTISMQREKESSGTLSVYDATGRLVWQQNQVAASTVRLDVSAWPSGVYAVSWLQGKKVLVKRLTVARG